MIEDLQVVDVVGHLAALQVRGVSTDVQLVSIILQLSAVQGLVRIEDAVKVQLQFLLVESKRNMSPPLERDTSDRLSPDALRSTNRPTSRYLSLLASDTKALIFRVVSWMNIPGYRLKWCFL